MKRYINIIRLKHKFIATYRMHKSGKKTQPVRSTQLRHYITYNAWHLSLSQWWIFWMTSRLWHRTVSSLATNIPKEPASLGGDFNPVLQHTEQSAIQSAATFGDVCHLAVWWGSWCSTSSVVCSDRNLVTATNTFTDSNRDKDVGKFDVEYWVCLYRMASSVTDL